MTQPTDTTPADELRVMARIVKALDPLDAFARIRVVAWLWEAYMGTPHVVEPASGGDRG